MNKNKVKYGVFIGRFQPLHAGHLNSINKIVEQGLIPVILIGSAQERGTEKNPLSFVERRNLIEKEIPNVITRPLKDFKSNEDWAKNVIHTLWSISHNIKEFTFFFHNKEEDKYDFTYKDIKYKNESYSKILEIEGLSIQYLPISNINVSATKIRNNPDKYKEFISNETYNLIKGLQND
jgi:bifunctional NMN adenylyltransferase/nudix hydrolase